MVELLWANFFVVLKSTNNGRGPNSPHFISGEHLGFNNTIVLSSPYGDHWRNLRRILSAEISSYRLQLFSNVRIEEIHLLIQRLGSNFDSKSSFQKVEFKTTFFELMLNTMMRLVCGKTVAELDEAQRFRQVVSETVYLLGAPNIADFLPFLRVFDLQGLEKRTVKTQDEKNAFIYNLINERRQKKEFATLGGEEKRPMIDILLSHQESDPEYYTDEIICGIIATMLLAGTDTTTATIEWTLSLLLNHPNILTKVKDEIDKQIGQKDLIQESDLPHLPYLSNMYPAGPLVTRETSKDCTVGNMQVAKGTMLQMNLWAVHRDSNSWEEPLRFNPGRFQGCENEKEGFKWMPFGTGRRGCPGQLLGLRMAGLAVGSLIQCFEWKRVGEELVDMTEGAGLTLPRARPLVAMCKSRPIMEYLVK